MGKLAIKGGRPVREKPFPSWPIYGGTELAALKEVLYSGVWGVGGKKKKEFEEKFAAYQNAKYGVAVANGTVALEVALRAAKVGAGDEIIVPAYTFVATASVVLNVNALPVFVDIEPETYCINPEKVEDAVTEKTKAVIPVHMAGHPADMDRITEIAQEHNLAVIEDAAQAHGARWRGKRVGSIGDMGIFSFQSSKNMTSGEGGIILTNDRRLHELCWSYHNCGRRMGGAWYEHHLLGGNYRITEFQAAVLLAQLERLEEQREIRTQNASYLSKKLSKIGGVRPLRRDPRVTTHSYHLYIFRYDAEKFDGLSRKKFIEALQAEGIPCDPGYRPLSQMPCVKKTKKSPLFRRLYGKRAPYSEMYLPITEKACREQAIWLKQNMLLGTKEDMDDIVNAITKIKESL